VPAMSPRPAAARGMSDLRESGQLHEVRHAADARQTKTPSPRSWIENVWGLARAFLDSVEDRTQSYSMTQHCAVKTPLKIPV
jgi:hypothetical protein